MSRFMLMTLCGLLVATAPLAAGAADAGEALAARAGCGMCHAHDKKGLGPSYRDMALRYQGDTGARQRLILRVRTGSKDNWGRMPMAPVAAARIGDAELVAVVDWILKQH